jgi:hypothetical protein
VGHLEGELQMNLQNYYQYYLTLHQNKWNIRLHVIGQLTTVAFVIMCFYYQVYALLLLTPFVVYPFAWSGHYFFEKNKPAAFSNPLYAKISDWIMLRDYFLRRLK